MIAAVVITATTVTSGYCAKSGALLPRIAPVWNNTIQSPISAASAHPPAASASMNVGRSTHAPRSDARRDACVVAGGPQPPAYAQPSARSAHVSGADHGSVGVVDRFAIKSPPQIADATPVAS